MTTTPTLAEGYRSADGRVYDVDEKRHQVVVSIPHERLDKMNTDFMRGAFAESFRRKPHVPMLAEHRPENLIGHTIRAEVLPLDNRLVGQFSSLEANPVARRYFAHIKDGDLNGWSFRFSAGEYTGHPSVRGALRYTRAQMDELSAVAFPAIPGTQTLDVRSAQGARYDPDLAYIDEVRQRGELVSLGAAMERYHRRDMEELHRTRGQLPLSQRRKNFDAFTRAEEAFAQEQEGLVASVAEAFARATANRR
jgi:HK97 family phage prohead protease